MTTTSVSIEFDGDGYEQSVLGKAKVSMFRRTEEAQPPFFATRPFIFIFEPMLLHGKFQNHDINM